MTQNILPTWYKTYKNAIETAIDEYLDTYFSQPSTSLLTDFSKMVRYAVSWGKRIRAILALESYCITTKKTFDDISKNNDIWKLCTAFELMHAYSLVHDDLPCMDDDELRRGEPTVWKRYGEYNAVLVGDMLNSLSFECLSSISDAHVSQQIIQYFSHSVWYYGMIGGQVEDLYYEEHTEELTPEILTQIHARKTGKLIEATMISWAMLWKNTQQQEKLELFAKKLGLAFQVKDDLLDVEWTPEETGKSVWCEQKGFVYLSGIEYTKNMLDTLISECRDLAKDFHSPQIDFLVEYIANRKK